MKIFTILLLALIPFPICNANELSTFKAFQTKIKLIAIDPGFGGKDLGPSGCNGRVNAKDVNLDIAKKVANKIENELGINVILRWGYICFIGGKSCYSKYA
jgi:hypothetical protein